MRWALRQPASNNSSSPSSRPTAGGSSATGASNASNPATSSGLIYIDPVNLRRTNASSLNSALPAVVQSAAAAAAVAASGQIQEETSSFSTSSTVNNLSRSFGIIVRQVRVSASAYIVCCC